MENTIKILKQIERTHLNLGLPTIFAKLIDLSNLGLFLLAVRGKGKTAVLDTIRDYLRHRDIMQVSIISYAGMQKMADKMSNRRITIINRDFSSFYTDYLKDVAINLMATLITDHALKADTGKYHMAIDDCVISFLSATQPQMLEKLNRIPTWESMYKDRFIRYPFLYWFGSPEYREDYPVAPLIEITPSLSRVALPGSIKDEKNYDRMVAIIERQTSEGRCRQYVEWLLKSHAALNGRDIVLKRDLEFLELFAGNLVLDSLLSLRERGVSRPLVFNSDSYIIFAHLLEYGGASRADLRAEYNVSNVTIQRNLNPLMARNLVKGSFGKDWYIINPKWMEKYANPVHKWFEEHSIHG